LNFLQKIPNKLILVLKKNYRLVFLFVIFVTSFVIRRIGLKYGFPLLTHPDEVFSIEPVYHMTLNKTLNSDTFNRPDQILLFLNFIYLNIVSYIKFGNSLANTFLDNQQLFYFYGRLLICFFGSLIPIFAYKIGKEFKLDFSIPAALIFSFFPSYVIHSHYITPDVLITLFTLIIILFTIKFVKTENRMYLYIATFLSAVNTAEKYPGLISFSIIFCGVILYFSERGWRYIIENYKEMIILSGKLVGLFLLSIYLVAPNLFIQFGKVIDAITFEARSTHLGADNLGLFGNLLFYFKSYISFVNLIGILLFLFGLFYLLKSRETKSFILFYGFIYWIIISMLALHWERWALPMYTTPNFFVAIGITYLVHLLKGKKIIKFVSLLLIFIFISYQILYSLSSSIKLNFTDTRVITLEYCKENNITSENSVFEGYTPFNPQFPDMIFDFENIPNDKIKYIILSSQMYQRYFSEPDRYHEEINFYNEIRSSYKLIYEISPTQVDSKNLKQAVENIGYYIRLQLGNNSEIRLSGPSIQIYEILE